MNKLTIEYNPEEVKSAEAYELIGKFKEVFGESAKVEQDFTESYVVARKNKCLTYMG